MTQIGLYCVHSSSADEGAHSFSGDCGSWPQHQTETYWGYVGEEASCKAHSEISTRETPSRLGEDDLNQIHSLVVCIFAFHKFNSSSVFPWKSMITSTANTCHPSFSPQEATLEQILQKMEVLFGFVSKPKAVREGQAAMCILRPLSAKELSQQKKNTASTASPSEDPSLKATQSKKSSVGSSDTKGESIEQWADGNKTFWQKHTEVCA